MTADHSHAVPTVAQLLKASVIAALIAALVLIFAVLPAEFGIDPTGVGKALGLSQLHAADAGSEAASASPTGVVSGEPVSRQSTAYKTQEMSITLPPNKGGEIKAVMQQGDSFVFNWSSNAPVNFDMHGEPFNAKNNEFTSYWKDVLHSESHGGFTAPFGGTHGWYWKNRGSEPVTVTVTVSGYFEKLYLP